VFSVWRRDRFWYDWNHHSDDIKAVANEYCQRAMLFEPQVSGVADFVSVFIALILGMYYNTSCDGNIGNTLIKDIPVGEDTAPICFIAAQS